MVWRASWSDVAKKQLKKLPKDHQRRIIKKTDDVLLAPFQYLERLQAEPVFRYRVGNYRIVVNVVNQELLIQILKVIKRSRVYD